jgi:hypothetical protein
MDFIIMFYIVAFIAQFIILFALHIIKDFNYFMEIVDAFYFILCACLFARYSTKSYFIFSVSDQGYSAKTINQKIRSRILFVGSSTVVCQFCMGTILFLRGINYLDIKGVLGLVEFEVVFSFLYLANALLVGLKFPETNNQSATELFDSIIA